MKSIQRFLRGITATRLPAVRARAISVTGSMHKADNVPNQDSAFTLLRPDFKGYQERAKRPRSGIKGAPGVFAAAVFDGHGPQGEAASALASSRMEYALDRLLSNREDMDLTDIARAAFKEVAAALDSAKCSADSGSTGSIVLVRDEDIVIANVGDSSVLFLSRSDWRRKRSIRYTSRDHRPSDEDEANRILAAGGHLQDDYVVDETAKNGIAVTRTLGDCDMHKYGCISEPEVRQFKMRKRDTAIVLASDGLWDAPWLRRSSVLKVAANTHGRTPQAVCDKLMGLAKVRGGPTDDCTIACITFD